jgi:hypothetical protein
MSTVRQKVTQVNKEAWKAEEEKNHGNKQIIDENANIDIDKIAKEADKEAEKVLKKVVSKVKKTKAKPKAKKTQSKKS